MDKITQEIYQTLRKMFPSLPQRITYLCLELDMENPPKLSVIYHDDEFCPIEVSTEYEIVETSILDREA